MGLLNAIIGVFFGVEEDIKKDEFKSFRENRNLGSWNERKEIRMGFRDDCDTLNDEFDVLEEE